jgi:hypothetical protein
MRCPRVRAAAFQPRGILYDCYAAPFPQHFLYFLPLPHGQGSFRPARGAERTGCAFGAAIDGAMACRAESAAAPFCGAGGACAPAALYVFAT